jgi:zinc protease
MDDLKEYFAIGYAPNNCTMVVVGDVTFDRVMALAQKYIEPIPRHDPPPPVRTKEPEQIGERRIVVKKPAQLPVQMIGYHVPEAKHPDAIVVDLITTILSRGQSSRLYKRMIDEEPLAIAVNAVAGDSIDPTLMLITIQPRSGVDPARTEKALYDELDRLQKTEVSARELQKAKNQMLTQHYAQLKTIAGRASLLGHYDILRGDYRKTFTIDKDFEAITAVDIQRVAQKYLTEKNRTVATLIPEKAAQ